MLRIAALAAACVCTLAAQQAAELNKLGLPNPSEPDVPYLIHGSTLLPLEKAAAKAEEAKNQLVYWVPGTASAVKTPLAAPEFLFDSDAVDPRNLQLYRFEASKGRRELLYRKKKKVVAEPFFLQLSGIEGRVVLIRINASLAAGEYGITPDGSDDVFLFAVF